MQCPGRKSKLKRSAWPRSATGINSPRGLSSPKSKRARARILKGATHVRKYQLCRSHQHYVAEARTLGATATVGQRPKPERLCRVAETRSRVSNYSGKSETQRHVDRGRCAASHSG